jgi:hypothetical protein
MNEAETRAEWIDPLLAAAGWGVARGLGSVLGHGGRELLVLRGVAGVAGVWLLF